MPESYTIAVRCLVISNPNSTSQAPKLQRSIIPALLSVTGMKSVFTAHPGHATELVSGLIKQDFDAVIAIGGDGTVNEVINGLLGDDPTTRPTAENLPALAVIPTGSANVFARAMGYSREPEAATAQLVAALRDIANGVETDDTYIPVRAGFVQDHCSTKRRWFVVNAGLGFDAEVIARMEKLRARGLSAAPQLYANTAVLSWLRMRRSQPHICAEIVTASRTERFTDLPLALVSNTHPWTYFGALPVVTNPESEAKVGMSFYSIPTVRGVAGFAAVAQMISDGRGGTAGLTRLLGLGPTVVRSEGVQAMELTSAEAVRFQIDGEYLGATTGLTFSSHPSVLNFVAPAAESTGVK